MTMNIEIHLEKIKHMRLALENIGYMQRTPGFSQDKELQSKAWEEQERYESLKDQLCALPTEDTEQNTTDRGALDDLEDQYHKNKNDRK